MKQKNIQEINDVSDLENVDTSEMDSDARKIYFLSTIVGALLTAITAWTLFFMFTELDDLRQLIKCGVVSIVIPVVLFPIYKICEKSNDYLKIVPCLKYTNCFNWILTAAPLFLVLYCIIRFGINLRMPGGIYAYLALLAVCFLICIIAAINASQAFDKEEPFHSMLLTYINDTTFHWWAAFFGLVAIGIILVFRSGWFDS